jgi:NADH-quinone oxidoreductase subunit N
MFMPQLEMLFMIVTVITISTGNIIALVQDNFKRILAFSGISHAGYMLLGLLAVPSADSGVILYYALAYGAANIAAFGVAITVFKHMGSEKVDAFNGLIKKQPFLAVCLILAMLSMASIPPFAGFWAKYFIFTSAISKGFLPITIVGVINTLLGVYYYFKVIGAMLLKPADDKPVKATTSYLVVIFITTLIVIAAGIVPGLVVGLL